MPAAGFTLFATPIGHCGIAWNEGDEGLAGVLLPWDNMEQTRAHMQQRFAGAPEATPAPAVQDIIRRVVATLEGTHDDLADIALDMNGIPPFNQRVYAAARKIPPGRTITYGAMAASLGEPGASRAVGQALGHNPFAPIVPCHRILAAANGGGGFSAGGGVSTKLKMLEIEKARFGTHAGLFDG